MPPPTRRNEGDDETVSREAPNRYASDNDSLHVNRYFPRKIGWLSRSPSWLDALSIALITALSLISFMAWLDNVHINTSNGLWKSVLVRQWKADFGAAPLDPSNYLYYPLVSTLCRFLDLFGVETGQISRQMALINTICASITIAIVYWMIRRLTGRRDIAVLAATPAQVVGVSVAFTLGWLIEWRMMFPTLPPFLLALALSQGPLLRRAGRVLLFLAAMISVVLLVVYLWDGHNGATGLAGLLWTGKGTRTAWAGFSWHKLGLVVSGMGEYWLGGHFLTGQHRASYSSEWGLAFTLQMVLLAAFILLLWCNRHDSKMRTVAIIFLGTLAAGELMNAYSQPEDPQMQLNVMPWLTVAAALVLANLPSSILKSATTVAAALVLVPLAYNLKTFSGTRGSDGRMQAALDELLRLSDPAQTIYVYSGMESIVAWHFAKWTPRWGGVCEFGPSPQPVPKIKLIGFAPPLIFNPGWTPKEYVASIKTELSCAFDRGYGVIAGLAWTNFGSEIDGWMTLLHARDHGLALQPVLNEYHIRSVGGASTDPQEEYVEVIGP
jgi:hypothetical protein